MRSFAIWWQFIFATATASFLTPTFTPRAKLPLVQLLVVKPLIPSLLLREVRIPSSCSFHLCIITGLSLRKITFLLRARKTVMRYSIPGNAATRSACWRYSDTCMITIIDTLQRPRSPVELSRSPPLLFSHRPTIQERYMFTFLLHLDQPREKR